MTGMFSNPTVRLALRALVAGATTALLFVQNSSDGTAAWKGAIAAGVLAFCEVFTPLNALVGWFKGAAK